MTIEKNYYEILGVAKEATADEIKKAYRKLASLNHPDKGGDTKKFQEIQSAYDVLSDPLKKQQYDMGGSTNNQFNWSGQNQDLNEIFRSFGFSFGGFGGFDPHNPNTWPGNKKNKDIRIEIPISLKSIMADQTKTIQLKTTNNEETVIDVKIPRGVQNGSIIKYNGLGDNFFSSIPRGDLYVHLNIQNDEKFQAVGLDLNTKVSVNSLLAIVGGKITVFGLDEKQFEITIPKGTQPGRKFRIPKQGLHQLSTDNRGDLYVEIALFVPENLTEPQLENVQSILNSLNET